MSVHEGTANLRVYRAPEVAAHYAALDYLTPCEQLLFSTYIKPGSAILDLGVGGGRTTTCLSKMASHYVGVDYSEEMILVCRKRFPQLQFFVSDASDLSAFENTSFDAIVMAFNTIDYVLPEERRWQCLRECRRVLRDGGVLIFSSHNPRSIWIRPAWDRARLHAFAQKFVAEDNALFVPFLFVLTVAKSVHSFLRAAASSATRVFRRVAKLTFWRGEGYLLDASHGGLLTHCWVPARVTTELAKFGFQAVLWLGDDYPRASHGLVTDWYYYVFQK